MDGEGERRGSIVVVGEDQQQLGTLRGALASELPDASLTEAADISELRAKLHAQDTDIVVVDCEWPVERLRELIYELKNADSQPALIVISGQSDSHLINELYKHGCQRFVLKDERWHDELGLALRHVLRLRQLLDENVRIRTRLTEANMMLDERNRRLDEFSATLAHDIRGPLGSISMKLEYLLDHHDASLDERSRDVMTRAFATARRLTGVVQAMYEFAKLGSIATRMEMLDLGVLVDEVINDTCFDPRLEIRVELGELPRVWGSEPLLRRLFGNLVSNAVKYNDKAETVIRILAGKGASRALGDFVEIRVDDNGPGISEADHADVFTMFRRGTSVDPSREGVGIGLAVVRRIIELHYGEIMVERSPLGGASFVFTLPLERISVL